MPICYLFTVLFLLLWQPCYGDFDIKQLSVEQKVGQLLVVHFHGEEVNPAAQTLIQQLGVGGFIYYNWANGLVSSEQVQKLSSGLQNYAKDQTMPIPLLIMVDQEGGRVVRLTEGFSTFPGNQEVGQSNDLKHAENIAYTIGSELKSVGINMNLAPVIDIAKRGKPTYMSARSFGDSPELVSAFARHSLRGYKRAGIIGTLKHFPGHGAVEIDSHCDMPILLKSKSELENWEFLPYIALADKADAIMTAHILVPKIDAVNCATLSKNVLDILRDEIGFTGLIVTDSLVMEGLLKNCASIDEAAIRAFNAGCDLLLLGGKQLVGNSNLELSESDIIRIHKSIVSAVSNGVISHQRLDESVTRILNLKTKYALSKYDAKKRKGVVE
jgi:beta-N-acetylhexosaminidase